MPDYTWIRNTPATISSDITLIDNNHTALVNAAGGNKVLTLPSAVGRSGVHFNIKKTDSSLNTITIGTTDSQTIDGATTYILRTQYERLTVISDGSNWFILSRTTPKNILRGITPTATGWGVAPTTLENTTDGDFATVTGTGSTTNNTAVGTLEFNLGATKNLLVGCRVGFWSTAGAMSIFLEGSDDNITYRTNAATASATVTSETIRDVISTILNGQYFRIRVSNSNGSTTSNIKIYETYAYELMV